jgi:hypothetical protein
MKLVSGRRTKVHNEELHILLFNQYYYNDHIMEDGMGRTCSTHGKDEKCVYRYARKTLKVEKTWKV